MQDRLVILRDTNPASNQRLTGGLLGRYREPSQNHKAVVVTGAGLSYIANMNLREQVEDMLPNWERWYPSLFDAASDLGIIKPEVCDPGTLLLTRRHARVRQRAEDAHREKWGGKAQE